MEFICIRNISEKTRIWMLIRQTVLGEFCEKTILKRTIYFTDGYFVEDNPIELLVWSQDKDLDSVQLRIDEIKRRGRGGHRHQVVLAEDEMEESDCKLGLALLGGK